MSAQIDHDDLAELLNTRRWCYYISREGFVKGRGYRVSIVIEGEDGYFPTGDLDFKAVHHKEPWFWGMTYEEAEETAAEQNQKLGLDVGDVWHIVSSSMMAKPVGRKPAKWIP